MLGSVVIFLDMLEVLVLCYFYQSAAINVMDSVNRNIK